MRASFVLTLPLALGLALPAPADDLRIRWLGQSFFVVTSSTGTRVAFDPHAIDAFGRPKAAADLVLITHPHPDHTRLEAIENRAQARVIEGVKLAPPPGGTTPRPQWNPVDEAVKDVKIRTVGVYHDMMQGMQRGKNTVFILEVDGLRIVHLGDLGHVLSDDQVRQIGPVDILMIPVGGVYTINGARAREVVDQLKPKRAILPMHHGTRNYDDLLPVDEFLEGRQNVRRLPTTNEYIVPLGGKAPESPEIVLLGWDKGR